VTLAANVLSVKMVSAEPLLETAEKTSLLIVQALFPTAQTAPQSLNLAQPATKTSFYPLLVSVRKQEKAVLIPTVESVKVMPQCVKNAVLDLPSMITITVMRRMLLVSMDSPPMNPVLIIAHTVLVPNLSSVSTLLKAMLSTSKLVRLLNVAKDAGLVTLKNQLNVTAVNKVIDLLVLIVTALPLEGTLNKVKNVRSVLWITVLAVGLMLPLVITVRLASQKWKMDHVHLATLKTVVAVSKRME